jgi:hypothetical protein
LVLALGELLLATAVGCVFGDKMDSFRAEAYGMLSVLCYIVHLFRYFNTPLPAHLHLTLWSDNQALIEKVTLLLGLSRPIFPNETMEPSYDVLQAIVSRLKELSGAQVDWVKGHHDRDISMDEMSTQERLNVRADKLAGDFQYHTAHKNLPAPLITGSVVQLRIRNRTIHSHCRRRVRFCRGEKKLKA